MEQEIDPNREPEPCMGELIELHPFRRHAERELIQRAERVSVTDLLVWVEEGSGEDNDEDNIVYLAIRPEPAANGDVLAVFGWADSEGEADDVVVIAIDGFPSVTLLAEVLRRCDRVELGDWGWEVSYRASLFAGRSDR